MPKKNTRARVLTLAVAIAGSMVAASAAVAGECPADKMKANTREKVDYKPVGVSDVTLGSIDLGKQPAHIEGRELRFRKLTIEPGGIVPWHSHDDRPALIFVEAGRDRRICQQLRSADHAQGRRYQAGSVRHLAPDATGSEPVSPRTPDRRIQPFSRLKPP